MRKSILVSGVLFKPAYPEDLDFLSSGTADNFLCAFVVDGDSEDIDESAVAIRVGVIVFGRKKHDVGAGVDIDNVGMPLEVIRPIINAKCLVNGYFATLINVGIEDVFPGGLVILNEQP